MEVALYSDIYSIYSQKLVIGTPRGQADGFDLSELEKLQGHFSCHSISHVLNCGLNYFELISEFF